MLLVTGITGHSGKFFLEELIKNSYLGKIRCIVREKSDVSLLKQSGLNIDLSYGDLTNQEYLDRAFLGVDTVLHIASIFYSEFVIKAAVKNNLRRAIFVHTTGVYSKYKSASKEYNQIEQNINEIIKKNNSNIGLIYLRPTMIYGKINDRNMIVFIKMVDKLRVFPVINNGRNLLQPVNGRDLGTAYFQVLMKPEIMSGDYVLSGEQEITMLDLLKLISKLLAKNTFFLSIPMIVAKSGAKIIKIISLGKIDLVEKVLRMGEDRHYSNKDAKRDFEYQPMKLSDGLELEIREYQNKKNE